MVCMDGYGAQLYIVMEIHIRVFHCISCLYDVIDYVKSVHRDCRTFYSLAHLVNPERSVVFRGPARGSRLVEIRPCAGPLKTVVLAGFPS